MSHDDFFKENFIVKEILLQLVNLAFLVLKFHMGQKVGTSNHDTNRAFTSTTLST